MLRFLMSGYLAGHQFYGYNNKVRELKENIAYGKYNCYY